MADAMPHSVSEPETGQAEPMIGDIPEAYFRAFVGKNADYYITRFRRFEAIQSSGKSANFVKLVKCLDINFAAIIVNVFCDPAMFLYRKEYLYFAGFWVIKFFLMLLYGVFPLIYANFIFYLFVVVISLGYNFLYYVHAKQAITKLVVADNYVKKFITVGGVTIFLPSVYIVLYYSLVVITLLCHNQIIEWISRIK